MTLFTVHIFQELIQKYSGSKVLYIPGAMTPSEVFCLQFGQTLGLNRGFMCFVQVYKATKLGSNMVKVMLLYFSVL